MKTQLKVHKFSFHKIKCLSKDAMQMEILKTQASMYEPQIEFIKDNVENSGFNFNEPLLDFTNNNIENSGFN